MSVGFDPYTAIQDAESATNLQERAALLESAIQHLTSRADLDSADVQYAIGYAWCLHPVESPFREEMIVAHLNEALRMNPDHKYACLYLAHYYFDRKQFSAALEYLSNFEPREFRDSYQSWRDVKIAEMILCCKLYLSDIDDIQGILRRFCESLTCLEPGMNPEPEEFAAVLHCLVTTARPKGS